MRTLGRGKSDNTERLRPNCITRRADEKAVSCMRQVCSVVFCDCSGGPSPAEGASSLLQSETR